MAQKETNIFNACRLKISELTGRLFRNNTGLFYSRTGEPVRCGLCTGSSDGIGWYPVTVTPDMVGKKLAIFLAIETKTPAGRLSAEQQNFIDQVNKAGGIGLCVKSPDDLALINDLFTIKPQVNVL